jgi:hypothetical protein
MAFSTLKNGPAHDFVKSALPFSRPYSHICLKPAGASVTTAGWLGNASAAARISGKTQ